MNYASIKYRLKKVVQSFPVLWGTYTRIKTEIRRVIKLHYFIYDIYHTFRSMHWMPNREGSLSAQLLFNYHKIEKGLVMPGVKRLFSIAPAKETISLLNRWVELGNDLEDPVYLGAIETLRSYHKRITDFNLDPNDVISSSLNMFLSEYKEEKVEYRTPQKISVIENFGDNFSTLMEARRSVRDYLPKLVSEEILRKSIRVAQLSPSVCNRQSWRIIIISDNDLKEKLLDLQNGNRGFGHLAPHVAVIASDDRCFFDASERHEPYVDGGLFSMSFILALRSNDISSCCLNWCVKPSIDRAAHRLLKIDDSFSIIMLVALGYAPKTCSVPRSSRRALDEVLTML